MSTRIHIGIDFGTSQSKVCINNLSKSQRSFYKFPLTNSFFLPSTIGISSDGQVSVGKKQKDKGEQLYSYFKIASAEDIEFRLETFDHSLSSNFYSFNEFSKYSPEVLSVLYLTRIILEVEEYCKKNSSKPKQKGGFLARVLSSSNQESDLHTTIRIGIPTEWSQKKTLERKRKFENILLLSRLLSKSLVSTGNYDRTSIDDLINTLKEFDLNDQIAHIDEFKSKLNEEGVSVYPETAAGLTAIIQEKMLRPGSYATMDIGGGSTDISFFRVTQNRKVLYYASESYLLASNNVYRRFTESVTSLSDLQEAEKNAVEQIKNGNWYKDKKLHSAISEVDKALDKKLYKLFCKRVFFKKPLITRDYDRQELILYGGGSAIPWLNEGEVLIHDNGSRNSLNAIHTNVVKRPISKFANNIDIYGRDMSWKRDFHALTVALGLSYLKLDEDGEDWIDDNAYIAQDRDGENLEQHPFNEDCYIYNVHQSRWN